MQGKKNLAKLQVVPVQKVQEVLGNEHESMFMPQNIQKDEAQVIVPLSYLKRVVSLGKQAGLNRVIDQFISEQANKHSSREYYKEMKDYTDDLMNFIVFHSTNDEVLNTDIKVEEIPDHEVTAHENNQEMMEA